MWERYFVVMMFCNFQAVSLGNACGKAIDNYESRHRLSHEKRIVGGYDIGYYKYPWYVAFIKDKIVGCGGTLINSRTIITAAHCFNSNDKTKFENYYVIKLGVYNVCISESTQLEVKAEKVKIHELYPKHNPYYDIAIVILEKEAHGVIPICLPPNRLTKRPKEGMVPGLGVLKYDGATPCTVHESRLLIQPDDECKKMLTSVEKNVSNLINAFCAGYIQGGIDTCQGDSGGPLQFLNPHKGEYMILGIVSFGYKCAAPGVFGLYTDVSQYLDWIRKNSVGASPTPNQGDITSTQQTQILTNVDIVSTVAPLATIPLPSVGANPQSPYLQFYPVRPIQQRPAINIFIFNRKRWSRPALKTSNNN